MHERREVPFFTLDREFGQHRDAYLRAVRHTLAHGRLLQGPEVRQLEERLAAHCGRRHAVALNSCTDALFFALKACGVRPGDEVLVTSFSFVASASPIVRLGATPVFVDIDESYNTDLSHAAERVTENTRALVFVHLFGQMGCPSAIRAFTDEHHLTLIEDAAQAFGASFAGEPAASLGRASCLSFDPTKVVSAPGSGGAVLTDDPELAEQVSLLRYHGKNQEGDFECLGYNSQMPSVSAALLELKIDLNAAWLERRRQIARYYRAHLPEEVKTPAEQEDSVHVFHKYVVRCKQRDAVRSALADRGVKTMVHYPKLLPQQPCLRSFADRAAPCPVADTVRRQVLSLPITPFLTDREVEYVVDSMHDVLRTLPK